MGKAPRISIVLPTYNGSQYLRESIESCLSQSYDDWELIIVDDASTDATPEIIAEYASRDPRIRALRNQANRRLPGSLNIGFSAARGEWLSWTSDDNAYRADALAVMASYLEGNHSVGFVYTDMNVVDEQGRVLGPANWVDQPDRIARGCCVGACFLYRGSLMESVGGYDESLRLAEDYDYWMRVSSRTKMHYIQEPLYFYRVHGASLTATQSEGAMLAHFRCQAKNLSGLRWLGRSARAVLLMETAWGARNRGDHRLARTCVWRSLRLQPAAAPLLRPKLFASMLAPDWLLQRWRRRRGTGMTAQLQEQT